VLARAAGPMLIPCDGAAAHSSTRQNGSFLDQLERGEECDAEKCPGPSTACTTPRRRGSRTSRAGFRAGHRPGGSGTRYCAARRRRLRPGSALRSWATPTRATRGAQEQVLERGSLEDARGLAAGELR